jgi:hypothetical protein
MTAGSLSTHWSSSVDPAGTNRSSAAGCRRRLRIQIATRQSRSGATCPTMIVGCTGVRKAHSHLYGAVTRVRVARAEYSRNGWAWQPDRLLPAAAMRGRRRSRARRTYPAWSPDPAVMAGGHRPRGDVAPVARPSLLSRAPDDDGNRLCERERRAVRVYASEPTTMSPTVGSSCRMRAGRSCVLRPLSL